MVKSAKAVALDYRLRPALRGDGGEPAGGCSLSRSAVPMSHDSLALRDDPARPFMPVAISRVRGGALNGIHRMPRQPAPEWRKFLFVA